MKKVATILNMNQLKKFLKNYPEQLSNILLIIRKEEHIVPNSETEIAR